VEVALLKIWNTGNPKGYCDETVVLYVWVSDVETGEVKEAFSGVGGWG